MKKLGLGLGIGGRNELSYAANLVSSAQVLNDTAPTYARASVGYNPVTGVFASSGTRRRRPIAIGTVTVNADLIEGGRTNKALQAQTFSNASWTKTRCSVASAQGTGPDSLNSDWALTEDSTATNTHVMTQAMTFTAVKSVCYAIVRPGTRTWCAVYSHDGTTLRGAFFNLATGAVGTLIGSATAIMSPFGPNGHYLCAIMFTPLAAAGTIQLALASADNTDSYSGDGTSGIYVWHYQHEAASIASTPIVTTTGTAARAADNLLSTVSLDTTAGTVLALCIPNYWTGDIDGTSVFELAKASPNANTFGFIRNNGTTLNVRRSDAGGTESTTIAHGLADGTLRHVAAVWDGTSLRGYVNGVLGGTDATVTAPYDAVSAVQIGANPTGPANFFYGWVCVLYWARALTANELLAVFSAFTLVAAANISCWGDSLTAGTGASVASKQYPAQLGAIDTRSAITNGGVGGETSTQIATRFIATAWTWADITIIWAGRNNFSSPTTVKADIASMVAKLGHGKFLILSVLNHDGSDEWSGTANYTTITTLNSDLAALYPNNYYDIRGALVAAYDPGTPQDVTDFGHDVPPSTLRSDTLHLNDAGYALVAARVNTFIRGKGWL